MKNNTSGGITIIILLVISTFFFACKKDLDVNTSPSESPVSISSHRYGLIPMEPSQWSNVPVFSKSIFNQVAGENGLIAPSTFPSALLLYSPQVRDQGQIGSCTGFCGTETDEILYYYKNNNITTQITGFNTSNGASTALNNEIPNTSDEPDYNSGHQSYANLGLGSNAFSPLFLYFVARVVINHNSIGSDNGAYMVNIGQALQGLSNNNGTGTALIYNGYTFKGIPNEIQYEYPFVLGAGGYNVASINTYPAQQYPYNYYNYGSNNIPVYPYRDSIGTQNGSTNNNNGTNNTNVTNHGYYVITSTGNQLITDVQTAIANNKPVMMGFNVYDKQKTYQYFEGLNTTNYTYNPLTSKGTLAKGVRLLGGHAVPIIGYINDNSQPGGGVFICENSWGTPWGYHGYFYLPYSVLQSTKVVPPGNPYVAII